MYHPAVVIYGFTNIEILKKDFKKLDKFNKKIKTG
jgi:hypothetical protein